MSVARVVSTVAASVAVVGCAVVVIGISQHPDPHRLSDRLSPSAGATSTSRPAYRPLTPLPTSAAARRALSSAVRSSAAARSASAAASHSSPRPSVRTSAGARPVMHTTSPRPVVRSTTTPRPAVTGSSLPLHYYTGTATRVITVVAHSYSSTTATLQGWTKAAGGGWLRYGYAVTAHVGADGLGNASEYRSATPTGSFTLTQAFGYYSNPGTALPYFHTTPADWWISQSGSLYNTHQHCSYSCPFTQGSPNEHLYYETPYYNYAVVVDYNTANAPGGVQQGKGSAIFLHVTDGRPTAGCVAIPQSTLIGFMRWLTPSAHPRILIGVT